MVPFQTAKSSHGGILSGSALEMTRSNVLCNYFKYLCCKQGRARHFIAQHSVLCVSSEMSERICPARTATEPTVFLAVGTKPCAARHNLQTLLPRRGECLRLYNMCALINRRQRGWPLKLTKNLSVRNHTKIFVNCANNIGGVGGTKYKKKKQRDVASGFLYCVGGRLTMAHVKLE